MSDKTCFALLGSSLLLSAQVGGNCLERAVTDPVLGANRRVTHTAGKRR